MIVVALGGVILDVLERIYQLRTERGWSEYQLAEMSGISQSTISSWYRKGLLPSIGSLEKICRGFGITLSCFFNEGGESISLTDEQKRLLDGWEPVSYTQLTLPTNREV